jgi:hypothetical protein
LAARHAVIEILLDEILHRNPPPFAGHSSGRAGCR